MVLLSKHKPAAVLLIALTVISILACKKQEDHTSFYFESSYMSPASQEESPTQQAGQLEVYKFTNNPAPYDVVGVNGSLNELLWLRATKSFDFTAMASAPAVSDDNRTQAKFMYDAENLYISVRCWDASTTFTSLNSGQDLRTGNSDLVCIYLEPDGDNQDIYSIQITPNGRVTLYVFPTASAGTFNAPALGTNNIIAQGMIQYNDGREGSFKGWCAEVKIPFTSGYYGMSTPVGGTTSWKSNIIRHNYDSSGTTTVGRGKYAWKDPVAALENNPGSYYPIRFNTNDISVNPFQIYMKGVILSGGAVHLPDHGFTGFISSYPFSSSTPLNISMGKRTNPGQVSYTQSVRVGDSLSYKLYVTRPDGSTSKSYYEQKYLIR